jgi:hypothetical protein
VFKKSFKVYALEQDGRNLPHPPLFSIFIGKNVAVDVDGCLTVEGRLIHYCESRSENHTPSILILENSQGRHIIRGGFRMIKRLG